MTFTGGARRNQQTAPLHQRRRRSSSSQNLLVSTAFWMASKWLVGQKADVIIKKVLSEGSKHETILNSMKHINDSGNSKTTRTNVCVVESKSTIQPNRKTKDFLQALRW